MVTCANSDEIRTLEVVLDGEPMFAADHSTRFDRLFCSIMCIGLRLIGTVLLVLAGIVMYRGEGVGAMNLGMLGLVVLLAGVIGVRQYQNAPRRIILDHSGLIYTDEWTGVRRRFPRISVLEAHCGHAEGSCAVYVVHPDQHVDLLLDGITPDIAQQVSAAINQHLQPAHA
jgi:hypothetical protein